MPLTVKITNLVREPNNGRVLLDYEVDGKPDGKEFANQAAAVAWVKNGLDDLDSQERQILADLVMRIRILRTVRTGANITTLIGKTITFDPSATPIIQVT